ncbi:MFS transporter [Burkholderia glumae]|uniref:Major facilitator superfamily (MFS) profile domain-containing protein n=1 Tax=Burkholderia glumae TaxID=337 RepID=A0AAP9Y708_BURGL|nr:MFS transporter [Burkholderia glumae]ACR30004.2 Major facilitator family transporter [Burkholderia glumae BGR1]AJY65657.1 major Facilitator Superfamily protein [Burkholderia glumae LMG 2196 = ATCC 33617]KHJ61903.1 hypothetical protein NCPPB3923_16295 [Burkholderia glumae]MCM2482352.1 hypothetical protein [Burkholderia glumae]MCM2507504.1 hypothetical protein [Burkholderia glumae]
MNRFAPRRAARCRSPAARFAAGAARPARFDVGAALDHGPFTPRQALAVLLAALSIVLDGFDGQLIGFAIPALIREWHLTRAAFAPAVAAGLVGMGIGSAGAGLLADRSGRRRAVIASVFVFGALGCAVAIARFGSRWPLLSCSLGGAASAAWLLGIDAAAAGQRGWLLFGLGLHGLFVNAVQASLYAPCAGLYPTPVRATGAAGALLFGRLGAILGAFAGAFVITSGGAAGYWGMLAAAMAAAGLALALLRGHLRPWRAQPGAAPGGPAARRR